MLITPDLIIKRSNGRRKVGPALVEANYNYFNVRPTRSSVSTATLNNFYLDGTLHQNLPGVVGGTRPGYNLQGSMEIRRASCAKRFCSGICNFFSRLTTTKLEDSSERRTHNKEESFSQPPPVPIQLSYVQCSNNHSSRPLYHPSISTPTTPPVEMINLTPLQPPQQQHLVDLRQVENSSDDITEEDDGEYIIYVPKASKTQLQKKYLDPLRKASYDPVVIRQCLPGNKTPLIMGGTEWQEHSFPKLHRALEPKAAKFSVNEETLSLLLQDQEPPWEIDREEDKSHTTGIENQDDPDGRHIVDNNQKIETSVLINRGVNKKAKGVAYFYIPFSSSSSVPEKSFKTHQKDIQWTSIHERHTKCSRNKQSITQANKIKWKMYFSAWSRRRLVGEMKKKLCDENKSLSCSPPNILESRFHLIHWLGNTGKLNNTVGRYFDKEENSVVALKIFGDKPFSTEIENLDNKLMAIQEINSLRKMNHRNIVNLLGYFELHDKYHLILESCDHSLRDDITEAPTGIGTSASKKVIKYVLSGLNFCHHLNCLHRDLCPENLLVCKTGLVKIGDFDRSVFLSENGIGTTCPTPGRYVYNAPEILAGDKEYGLPSDIWSIGIIFCELLTGQPPWNGRNTQSQLREIHNSVGPLLPRHASIAKLHQYKEENMDNDNNNDGGSVTSSDSNLNCNHAQLQQMFTTISVPCCSFIRKCLDVNPQNRFSCEELLRHQFIKDNYK